MGIIGGYFGLALSLFMNTFNMRFLNQYDANFLTPVTQIMFGTIVYLSWESINMIVSAFLPFLNICESSRVEKNEQTSSWAIVNWWRWFNNEIQMEDGEYFLYKDFTLEAIEYLSHT